MDFLSVISDRSLRVKLHPQHYPYFTQISVGRYVGYHKPRKASGYWVARMRTNQGLYVRSRLGEADDVCQPDGLRILSLAQALDAASRWFADTRQVRIASDTKPGGSCSTLMYSPVGAEYTVGHAISDFLTWKKVFGAPQSFHSCLSLSNAYILPRLGTIAARELSTDDLRHFMEWIASSPRKVGACPRPEITPENERGPEYLRRRRVMANNVLSILRTALTQAWEDGKIDDDRSWRRMNRFRCVDHARPNILTWQQCHDLLAVSPPDFRRLVLAALFTGCRITELLSLRAEDLSRNRQAIYIRPIKTYRGRHIALPAEGYEFFEEISDGKGAKGILLRRDSGKTWTRAAYTDHLRSGCRAAGIDGNLVFHGLRHTYASLLLQAGTPQIVVSRQLGHANMMSVIRSYSHCTDDIIDEELRAKFRPNLRGNLEI